MVCNGVSLLIESETSRRSQYFVSAESNALIWRMPRWVINGQLAGGRIINRRAHTWAERAAGERTFLHGSLLIFQRAREAGVRREQRAQAQAEGGAFSLFSPLFLFTNGARRARTKRARAHIHTHSNSNNNSCISAYKTRGATFIRTDIACMTKMK